MWPKARQTQKGSIFRCPTLLETSIATLELRQLSEQPHYTADLE